MDIDALVAFLAPFLPYLLKTGERVAEQASKELGTAAWKNAQAIWEKLRPRLQSKSGSRTDSKITDGSTDQKILSDLQQDIRKLIETDPELASDLSKLWGKFNGSDTYNNTYGNRNIVIKGNVNKSTLMTGNKE